MSRIALAVAAGLLLCASCAFATTWIVDVAGGGDFLAIQEAVLTAADGDLTLCSDSPCLPNNNGWAVTMGGLGQGCGDCGTGLPGEEISWTTIRAVFR